MTLHFVTNREPRHLQPPAKICLWRERLNWTPV